MLNDHWRSTTPDLQVIEPVGCVSFVWLEASDLEKVPVKTIFENEEMDLKLYRGTFFENWWKLKIYQRNHSC